MDEKLIKKDLTYLNDMLQESEKTKKKLSVLRNQEQLRFKLLKIYSQKLHDIRLKVAPQIMSKHRENLSFYHTKTKKIFWTVGLIFFVPRNKNTDQVISEDYKWLADPQEESQMMIEIIEQQNINKSKLLILLKDKANTNKLLEAIKESKVSGYIRDESNLREKVMFQIDWWSSLSDNIKNITLVEYPVLYLVFSQDNMDFMKEYKIIKKNTDSKR